MELTETLDCWVLDPQRPAPVWSFCLNMFADIHAFNSLQQLSRFSTATSAAAWFGLKLSYSPQSSENCRPTYQQFCKVELYLYGERERKELVLSLTLVVHHMWDRYSEDFFFHLWPLIKYLIITVILGLLGIAKKTVGIKTNKQKQYTHTHVYIRLDTL